MLLLATGLPRELYPRLFEKIMAERFDAGSRFAIEEVEGGRQRRVVLTPGGRGLDAQGDVFLVDHAWSFRLGQAREQACLWGKCVGGGGGGGGGGEAGGKAGMNASRHVGNECGGGSGERAGRGWRISCDAARTYPLRLPQDATHSRFFPHPSPTSPPTLPQLESLPKLAARMAALMCVGAEDEGEAEGEVEGEGGGEGKAGDVERAEGESKGTRSVDDIASRAVLAALAAQSKGGEERRAENGAYGEVEGGVESDVEWLEMDGEGIDDDMLASMKLHERFPVSPTNEAAYR
ncbi:unnamed protein product [Closterium sp. NIES-53]